MFYLHTYSRISPLARFADFATAAKVAVMHVRQRREECHVCQGFARAVDFVPATDGTVSVFPVSVAGRALVEAWGSS